MKKNTTLTFKDVMNSSDKLKKKIVDNYFNYSIEPSDICKIIMSVNDDAYKVEVLKTMNDIDFRIYQKINIALSIVDDEYKKEVIKHSKVCHLNADLHIMKILFSMSDESIKDVLENYKSYGFSNNTFCHLVSSINDDNLKKEILKDYKNYGLNDFLIAKIIASIDDDKYKIIQIKKFRKMNKESSSIAKIIESISDDVTKYIHFKNYKKYNFSGKDIVLVVTSFKDQTFIYKILDDYELYNFDFDTLVGIISSINDDFYKTNVVIENIYNFGPMQLTQIVESLKSLETKENIMDILYNKGIFGTNVMDRNIVLPDDMSIGIEIETEGEYSKFIRDDILPKGWSAKLDYSIKDGVEVVSPILYKGEDEQINNVCNMLKEVGQYTTSKCAGHVHIGANYFYGDYESYMCLLELFSNTESILYLICNQEGDLPRNSVMKFFSPISQKISNYKKENPNGFNDINSFIDFSTKIKELQSSRFVSLNFDNLGEPHKDTIEFRMANGTLDPNVWVDNINLFGNLMCAAKMISQIKKKSVSEMNDNEKTSLYFYEKLKDNNISERYRLKCLLSLFPNKIDKMIYLNRYDVNSELVKGLVYEDFLDYVNGFRPIVITEASEELKEIIRDNYQKRLEKAKLVRKR